MTKKQTTIKLKNHKHAKNSCSQKMKICQFGNLFERVYFFRGLGHLHLNAVPGDQHGVSVSGSVEDHQKPDGNASRSLGSLQPLPDYPGWPSRLLCVINI